MRIKIEFEVDVPDIPHTEKELEEYLEYTYGIISSIHKSNPFFELGSPDAIEDTFYWDFK